MDALATINVNKEDGSSEEMIIVTIFENNNKMYMKYRSKDEDDYYGASISVDSDDIETDLSDSEKTMMNNMFKELNLGGDYNA